MKRFQVGLAVVLAIVLWPAAANAFSRTKTVDPDQGMTAIVGGDETALVEGCGWQPIPGYTFCRQVEGDVADKAVSFIGPPADCSRTDACVFVKVFDQTGMLVWGDAIPKGQTRVTVPWRKLLGCDSTLSPPPGTPPAPCTFSVSQKGIWDFNEQVFYRDSAGHDTVAVTQGEIRLRVHALGYAPLNAVANDPSFVWSWTDGGFLYKMTAGLRTFVGKAATP